MRGACFYVCSTDSTFAEGRYVACIFSENEFQETLCRDGRSEDLLVTNTWLARKHNKNRTLWHFSTIHAVDLN
jgi:hypothetical protein